MSTLPVMLPGMCPGGALSLLPGHTSPVSLLAAQPAAVPAPAPHPSPMQSSPLAAGSLSQALRKSHQGFTLHRGAQGLRLPHQLDTMTITVDQCGVLSPQINCSSHSRIQRQSLKPCSLDSRASVLERRQYRSSQHSITTMLTGRLPYYYYFFFILVHLETSRESVLECWFAVRAERGRFGSPKKK